MALIQYASNLDNTWVLCRERAQQAGRLLADAISDTQAVGQRPVTLVGYSMGARVIFYCLQTLWKRRKLHVVCDCVLIGLPASLNTKQWTAARDVVSRRLVNVYSRSDWLLAFLYRWMEWGVQVAGLSPVRSVGGVENYDVTGLVKSHAQYPEKMNDILAFIGFDA
ncbi:transmembrane protein [Cystoisospora suis]|uniref:Transmembrane protein n=1 Tax=Cystoisospora suis TaxID=483139 RepID=A0A2C6LHB5_9APIC|nr:transmembrane protein [Cystoisospora suis]